MINEQSRLSIVLTNELFFNFVFPILYTPFINTILHYWLSHSIFHLSCFLPACMWERDHGEDSLTCTKCEHLRNTVFTSPFKYTSSLYVTISYYFWVFPPPPSVTSFLSSPLWNYILINHVKLSL